MNAPLAHKSNLRKNSPPWLTVSAGKWSWKIHAGFNSSELLRRLAAPEAFITAATKPLREDLRPRNTFVTSLAWPECYPCPLVLKRFRPLTLLHSLKTTRGSPAIAAFEKAFLLLNQNILTALPVAASETRWKAGRPESFLITEYVPNAQALREFRQGTFSKHQNRIVICRLAETIAQLHNTRISHTDPSASNFFVQHDDLKQFQIVLIDLDGLRPCREISPQKTAADLTFLCRRIPMSTREKLWFLSQYCRTRKDAIASRDLLALLEIQSLAEAKKPTATQLVQRGSFCWEARRGVLHQKVLSVMTKPESFLKTSEFYFKNSRVVTVSRVPGSAPGEPDLVLRRLKYGKLSHRIKDTFRASRTRRALYHGLLLEKNGIATPRAFAATETRQLRLPTAAYLITEQIPGAQTLIKFVSQTSNDCGTLAVRLADLLARLHNKGFSHRDLKPTNILIDENLNPFLIDLDGLRVWKSVTAQRSVADLVRLAQGISGHRKKLRFSSWRFLKRYCEQREGTFAVRDLAAQIGSKISR